jgi:hypothetical protein
VEQINELKRHGFFEPAFDPVGTPGGIRHSESLDPADSLIAR